MLIAMPAAYLKTRTTNKSLAASADGSDSNYKGNEGEEGTPALLPSCAYAYAYSNNALDTFDIHPTTLTSALHPVDK